ncbi:MAG: hypothetical protein KAU14_05270 [Thermoplasmata archaeon]|nr:hypothetical protein [Thermoplasmata archaeon]
MQEPILPDCTDFELELTFTPEEEEQLLQEIAEKGKRGLEEFAAKYSASLATGELGERLRRYRERLEQQAFRLLDRREKELEEGLREKEKRMFRQLEEFRQGKPHVIPDMERINLIDLEEVMGKDDLLDLVKAWEPGTLRERIKAFFLGIYLWLIRVWVRIKAFFRRKKKITIPGKKRRKTSLAIFGGKLRYNIGAPVSELLRRPGIRKRLKRELQRTGEYSSKDFEEQAEHLLERHFEAAVKRELDRERDKTEEELRKMEKEEKELRKQLEGKRESEGQRRERDLKRLREELRKKTEDPVKRLIERNLIELGFIQMEGENIIPTTALLERFADLIFQKELNALPYTGARSGCSERKLGIYEQAKMRSVYEESRMDIVTTIVNTRINHPGDKHIYDEDIMVYREESAISTHVIIMFDKSSSMEENKRIDAAKRTVMALYRAVKRQKEKDRIDIIGFDTHVSLMDLMAVWQSEPRGFTNISGALRTARLLFEESRADLKIAYLITDGLPEAYTDEKGRDIAGEPEISMSYALGEAKDLNAHLTLILLEPEQETYVEAGKKIVSEARGKLIVTNPRELMHEVLADYLR